MINGTTPNAESVIWKLSAKKLNMSPKFYKIKQSLDIIKGAESLPLLQAVNNQMLRCDFYSIIL